MIIIAIPICILGLFGNAMVISFISWQITKTRFTLYIMNTTAADFIVLLYQYIYFMLFLVPNPVSSSISRFLELMYLLGCKSSFYILTAMCVERYSLVYFPIWYQHHRLKNLSIFCVMLWVISGLVALVEYDACQPRFYANLNEDSLSCKISVTTQLIIEYLIFLPVMIFCTLAIVSRAQQAQQTPPAALDFTIGVTVLLFVTFYSSIRFLHFLEYWFDTIYIPIFTISVLFDSISSSINPYIYFLIGGYIRKCGDPLEILLGSALCYEEEMLERTQADQ
ncbi:proto-oncogene Mas-like [Varanus komodoensis]|uniref:proto-oncogene Mas-like n=1 Tax=Varanus komodoensis TaxID=61221 RepID=UPI001CF7A2C8|nr:proto-oncogene Mas-like [Varanus komodoensis]